MKYISTRDNAPVLGFCETVMTGLARDGGLYLPESYPHFSPDSLKALRGKSYATIAKTILWPFVDGEIDRDAFDSMVDEAYQTFRHPAVCPLVQTNTSEFILELFHGPTLAFKDVAMQLLGRLMDYILKRQNTRATIIGATSGDTGGAAIEAFAGRERCDIFILFPKGHVSPVQQRQMTTNNNTNVHAIAIEGNFDDCQALVKAMFNDHAFRDKTALSGVNYFTSAISLGAPDRAVSFTVPTGNFGDIFAAFVASRMGLPIARLVIATNDNDILVRTLSTGNYQIRSLKHTTSPSMDIQVSSNFERLLFEASGRNAILIRNAMENLKQSGEFFIDDAILSKIRTLFSAGLSTETQTARMIDELYKESHYLADPHTAIAVKVAREHMEKTIPMVVLSTAHPAKFPDAVKKACGQTPELPEWLDGLMEKPERYETLENDEKLVKDYILKNSRACH